MCYLLPNCRALDTKCIILLVLASFFITLTSVELPSILYWHEKRVQPYVAQVLVSLCFVSSHEFGKEAFGAGSVG